jgi:hypothetical protein
MDNASELVAADEQIAETMAAEHESLSPECRADAARLNACSHPTSTSSVPPEARSDTKERLSGWPHPRTLTASRSPSRTCGDGCWPRASLWSSTPPKTMAGDPTAPRCGASPPRPMADIPPPRHNQPPLIRISSGSHKSAHSSAANSSVCLRAVPSLIIALLSRQAQLSQTPVKDIVWLHVGHNPPVLPSLPSWLLPPRGPRRVSIHVLQARRVCICSSVATCGVPSTVPSPHSKWLQSGSCRSLGTAPVGVPSKCTG